VRRPQAARRSDPPRFIEPCHPASRDEPPSGSEWLYEIKIDGYRAQLHLDHGAVTVHSRHGHDWTIPFRSIARSAAQLGVSQAILDGEAAVLGSNGLPDFQALRHELRPDSSRLIYYAFDLLWHNGQDLRRRPLIERKRQLKKLLEGAPANLVYVDFLEAEGEHVLREACRLGFEGVVAKRRDSPYRSGRQETWLKLKCIKSDTFPIIAFVEKLGARPRRIASLYVGRREGDRLLYAGKVQTGFKQSALTEIREVLDPYIQARSPLAVPVRKPKATWVRPLVQAEIAYASKTDDGLLRQAVFKGLREDLAVPPSPPAAISSKRRGTHGVPAENILQLLPDAVAPSKEELRAYWRRVAQRALAHLARRPLKLVRHTHGITFYHRGLLPEIPAAVHKLTVHKREGGEGVRVWIDDLDGLLGLVDMDVIELHPWNATIDDLERADRMVLDIDPGDGVPWDAVVETALRLRELLRRAGLESWPKVTGGKGLHVMAPLSTGGAHDQVRDLAYQIAQALASAYPGQYILSAAPEVRHGRIFLDYLRNGRGNTAVGAYSPRARRGFPIAAPVSWSQVKGGIPPDAFSLRRPLRRA
jgi:bifunctional non-homologous end joining protein LigD